MRKICILYCLAFNMLITGCAQSNYVESDLIDESVSQSYLSTESETSITDVSSASSSDQEETLIDRALRDQMHNIYEGTLGETEIRVKISRVDNLLYVSYITRNDEENSFEGTILNDTEFELSNQNGDYLKGAAEKNEEGIIFLNGTGTIFERDVKFTLSGITDMEFGFDFDNYYSVGDSKEIEAFARKIKNSINDREAFVNLFKYPITIYIDGEPVFVQNQDEMKLQYDWLIKEDGFREEIEHMFTKYLFKNYLGVCVENGILWFNGDKITALSYRKK